MYSLVFSEDALAEMRALEPPTMRRAVASTLQRLALVPDSPGLAQAIDDEGRVNRIGVFNTVAFVFWTDHAMKRVRVIAVMDMAT